jgi:SAM-dependent methyltransferase
MTSRGDDLRGSDGSGSDLPGEDLTRSGRPQAGADRSAASAGAFAGTFLVDAHVHWYDTFGPALLDRAAANLAAAAQDLALSPAAAVLLFTESSRDHAFADLRTGRLAPPGWSLTPSGEDRALLATHPDHPPLILIAGRQIVTAEGLEVLALGTPEMLEVGWPLAASVGAVREAGGLPVLPWGFGKWWGARGRILSRFLESEAAAPLFLGDTVNRPAGLPRPAPFGQAARKGIFVLPGSDPLPLAGGDEMIGRYGFVLDGWLDRDRPATDLLALLAGLGRQPRVFGRLASPVRVAASQVAMQWHTRIRPPHGLAHDVLTPDVETASEGYARRFAGPVGAWFLEVQRRLVLQLLPTAAGRPLRILEVGGGHGQLTDAFLAAGHEVVVHGSAAVCMTRLRGLRARYPAQLRIAVAPLWALPFPDGMFDAVIGVRLLAHVERHEDLLAEMARVCRGRVIVDFPPKISANLLEPLLFQVKRRLERNTRPFFVYRPDEVMRALAAAGCGHFRLEKQFFWPMVVHRKAGRRGLSEALERLPRAVGMTRMLGAPALLAAERLAEPPP